MSTRLTYHGAASFDIARAGRTAILIDPFLSENPLAPCSADDLETPDVILVSHAAFDHYGDSAAIAKRTGAPVVCDAAVRAMLIDDGVDPDQVSATTWGIVVEVAGLQIRPVECHHWSSGTLKDGRQVVGNPIAFLVETEPGVRIYHYGDTAIFDMRLIGELYRPTVGLLGCTLPKELSHRIPGPATLPDRRDGRRRGGPRSRDARARAGGRLPLPCARTRRSSAFCGSSRSTTARAGDAWSPPWSGRPWWSRTASTGSRGRRADETGHLLGRRSDGRRPASRRGGLRHRAMRTCSR